MTYKPVDKAYGYSLEVGDVIIHPENPDLIVHISKIEDLADGYRFYYFDEFEDEELSLSVDDNEVLKILAYFDENA